MSAKRVLRAESETPQGSASRTSDSDRTALDLEKPQVDGEKAEQAQINVAPNVEESVDGGLWGWLAIAGG